MPGGGARQKRFPHDSASRAAASGRTLDVAALLDQERFSGFHYRVFALSWLITMFDGLDLALMAYTAPYIRDELGVTSGMLGRLFSAAVLGQILGGFLISHLADRYGRRPAIVVSAIAFGLLTMLTALAQTYPQLLAIRFLDGMAIGGMLPVAWALNIELAPKRRRASVVAFVMLGYSVGSASAGPLTNLIAPSQGWEGVYVCAGAATFIAALILLKWLPESIRFLVAKGRDGTQIAGLLQKLAPEASVSASDRFVMSDESPAKARFNVRQLFEQDLRLITPLLWLGYMASAFAMFLNSSWGPSLLEEMQVPRRTAALVASLAGLSGALVGALLVRMTEQWGPRAAMICPALALPVLILLGTGLVPGDLLIVTVLITGILIAAGHAAVISMSGIYYPSAIRASGGGWATSVAKFGAVLGPLVGGAVLGSDLPVVRTYLILAICPLLLCLAMAAISAVLRRRRPEASDAPQTLRQGMTT
jgi:AAHS family 4-hydroxybenzoate transporter-like MFS transporter